MDKDSRENVVLYIRCALQSFEDMRITCPLEFTIEQLKCKLQRECLMKPEASRQRLIYAGQCLSDDRTLRSIFEGNSTYGENDFFVIHLVCPPKDIKEYDNLRYRNTYLSRAMKSAQSSSMWQGEIPNSQNSSMNDQDSSHHANLQTSWANTIPTIQPITSYMNPHFLAAYNAYMTAYAMNIQRMIYASSGNIEANSFWQPLGSRTYFPPLSNQQVQQGPQVGGAAANNNAEDQDDMVQDALGGIDAPQRDFLDWIYKAIRLFFLLLLVLVYSTPERFIGVLLFIIGVWYLQARRIRNNAVGVENRSVADLGNGNGATVVPQEGSDDTLETIDATVSTSIDGIHHEPSPWTVFWSTCYTFITSFFFSLIPENPVPVDLN